MSDDSDLDIVETRQCFQQNLDYYNIGRTIAWYNNRTDKMSLRADENQYFHQHNNTNQ